MEIINFRKVNHRTIKANFNVFIPKWNLYLNKMMLVETEKGKFISMPSELYEKNGEKKYFPYYSFSKEASEAFKEKVMLLVLPLLEQPTEKNPSIDNNSYDDLPF